MEKLHITKNKVTVYSYDMPHLHSFYLSLNIKAGAIYEETRGITHLLEHVSCMTLYDLFQNDTCRELEKYGLSFNGMTDDNVLRFTIEGNAKFFKEACNIFVTLLNQTYTPQAFKVEKDRLFREIEENYNPTHISSLAKDAVWDGTPLASHQTTETIRLITLNHLRAEYKKIFTAKNMFFYATGAISQEALDYFYCLIESYSIRPGKEERKNVVSPPVGFLNRKLHIYAMPASYSAVSFNFDYEPKKYAPHEINFLTRVLFRGGDSIIYKTLSFKRGLIYECNDNEVCFDNVGNTCFDYEVASESLFESIKAAVEILRSIKIDINDFDFNRVRVEYSEKTHYTIDDVEAMNERMTYDNHICSYDYIDFLEISKRYSTVTKERLQTIAQEIFTPQNITLIIKWEKKPDIKRIRELVSKI